MDLELTGKVAWVTGGSGGLGSAIARVLGQEGCELAITGRDAGKLDTVARELADATGRTVIPAAADTACTGEVEAAAAKVVAALGGIDILINCAGAPGGKANGPLEKVDPELLIEDVNEKYAGYLRCARAAAPSMRQRRFGRIIHVGGLSARQSGTYSAGGRNAAIAHLSKTLADELGCDGITSNIVHPALTRSPWLTTMLAREAKPGGPTVDELERERGQDNAIGRLVDITEIADVVAFLASPKSVAITGETIGVGGGAQRGVSY